MSAIDKLAKQILADLYGDFRAKGLGADALSEEYVGITLADLQEKHCAKARHSKVDYDLALKQLEDDGLVKTGPLAPYENSSDSSIMVLGLFSKREFAYLTEKGYRLASNPL